MYYFIFLNVALITTWKHQNFLVYYFILFHFNSSLYGSRKFSSSALKLQHHCRPETNMCWMDDLIWNIEKYLWIYIAVFYFAGNVLVVHISSLILSKILELHCNNYLKITYLSETHLGATSFQKQKEKSLISLHLGQEWHGEHLDSFHQCSLGKSLRTLDGYGIPASDIPQ